MREIPVANRPGLFAIVDDDDYERVFKHKWTLQSHGYVRTWINREMHYLHRFVMGAKKGEEVDHQDLDKLNCCKHNLRKCTRSQNNMNIDKRMPGSSPYKGVNWDEDRGKFLARIGVGGRGINLGRYKTAEEAARAYDRAALQYFGEFARLNFPVEA